MKRAEIHFGSNLDLLPAFADNTFDSIVTDPPYGLEFMGKGWDKGVPGIPYWVEALRVAKPGAHMLAFGGTRMHHRLMVAIEDAGWELRDVLMWTYGSGFPKSRNVARELERIGADGADWTGWGTALKPAWEPIILARKPMIGTIARNVITCGTGGLNIDGCRVFGEQGSGVFGSSNATVNADRSFNASPGMGEYRSEAVVDADGKVGRWPANLVHDGSEEVLAGFPTEAGGHAGVTNRSADKFRNSFNPFPGSEEASLFFDDSGSAARFFYCAKATASERDAGLEQAQQRALAYGNQALAELKRGNLAHADAKTGMNTVKLRGNNHPTVKPLALMRWCVRLVTPPGGRVLDQFVGSGTTGCAAILEGFEFDGMDEDADYVEIARARLRAMQPGLAL